MMNKQEKMQTIQRYKKAIEEGKQEIKNLQKQNKAMQVEIIKLQDEILNEK